MTLDAKHLRYLRLLGFDEPPSGVEGLRSLVVRQVCCVPFENISKLMMYGRERRARLTGLPEYLDGIEFHDFGGTCYTANPYFAQLLAALDYDVDLLAASMRTPNVHTCIRVRMEGKEYHVDVGYAAPFRQPIPLDRLPLEIHDGSDRYVVGRSEDGGELTIGAFSGRDRIHGYRVHDKPLTIDFFEQTILHSYLPSKTFMTCLRVARFSEQGSVHLRNCFLTINDGRDQTTRQLGKLSELEETFAGPLAMPRCPVREAVAVLEEQTQQSFFAGQPFVP